MSYWHEFGHFPPSRPKEVKGGIKARSKRGDFAESWWGRRWIETLESFSIGARLGRGRAYARKGQVLSLDIGTGSVSAKVQGSRRSPYKVAVALKPIPPATWEKIAKKAVEDLSVAARLMAGELSPAIEEVFKAAKAPLFPATARDLKTDCSCPDWSNPCKHVAAVYYLLAEEFDRDPFLLFRLRGMGRERFLGLLGVQGGEEADDAAAATPTPRPLTANGDGFWSGTASRDDLAFAMTAPERPACLVRHLGGFPFWRGDEDPVAVLSESCDKARLAALNVLAGSAVSRR